MTKEYKGIIGLPQALAFPGTSLMWWFCGLREVFCSSDVQSFRDNNQSPQSPGSQEEHPKLLSEKQQTGFLNYAMADDW